jgi:hypothetical protein
MAFDRFPAIDESFDFPVEVREQLAKSEELRNLVIPMTETARDNLAGDELWIGRTIFNTTTNSIESWKSPGAWLKHLDETYDFPEPPPFWDENYDVPVEVRERLASSSEFKGLVLPLTETDKNNLTGSDLWHGRTIYNTTLDKLETWNLPTTSWVQQLDETYEPPPPPDPPAWQTWEPVLEYVDTISSSPVNWTAEGSYIKEYYRVTATFAFTFNGAVDVVTDDGLRAVFCVNLPEDPDSSDLFLNTTYGTILMKSADGSIRFGVSSTVVENYGDTPHMVFHYTSAMLTPVRAYVPFLFTAGCSLKGQIIYKAKTL